MNAVLALGRMGSSASAAVADLVKAAEDRDPMIEQTAAQALANLGGAGAPEVNPGAAIPQRQYPDGRRGGHRDHGAGREGVGPGPDAR
jgi:hypothetical protein